MKILFVLLFVAGVGYFILNSQGPALQRVSSQAFQQALNTLTNGAIPAGDSSSSKPSSAAAHPGDPLPAIRDLSQDILKPLTTAPSMSLIDTQKALADLRKEVAIQSQSPQAAQRVEMALNLLQQAVNERAQIMHTALGKTQGGTLDKVPGNWHKVGHPEEQVDLTKNHEQLRSSFWAQSAIAQWKQRSADYSQKIAQLLQPDTRH